MAHLVGWALVNARIKTPLYARTYAKIAELQAAGAIPAAARVCVGQKCLDDCCRGLGLIEAATLQLHRQVAARFDVYFATVLRANLRSLSYHERAYIQVAEDDEKVYFIRHISADAPGPAEASLPVAYAIRPGRLADCADLRALNLKWARATRGDNLADGFLTTLYSADDFQTIIAANEIAVIEQV